MRTKKIGVTRVPVLLNAGKQALLTAPHYYASVPRSRTPATLKEPDKLGKYTVCPTRCKTARLAGRIVAVPVTAGAARACRAHRNSIAVLTLVQAASSGTHDAPHRPAAVTQRSPWQSYPASKGPAEDRVQHSLAEPTLDRSPAAGMLPRPGLRVSPVTVKTSWCLCQAIP